MCETCDVAMMAIFTEADGFALAMLVVILLSFGVLIMLGFCMFRNASRRNGDVDRLIEELTDDEKNSGVGKVAAGDKLRREVWEKDGDWWREE